MSSKGFFFSSGSAYFGFGVTPASFCPCAGTAPFATAGSASATALPAPSFRNSRRLRYSGFGVISDQRIDDLRPLLRRDARGGYASAGSALRTIGGTGAGSGFGVSTETAPFA